MITTTSPDQATICNLLASLGIDPNLRVRIDELGYQRLLNLDHVLPIMNDCVEIYLPAWAVIYYTAVLARELDLLAGMGGPRSDGFLSHYAGITFVPVVTHAAFGDDDAAAKPAQVALLKLINSF